MKKPKRLIILLGFITLLNVTASAEPYPRNRDFEGHKDVESSVYVCLSRSAVAYHNSSSCRGLNRCTHQIKSMSRSLAIKNYGLRACKICY